MIWEKDLIFFHSTNPVFFSFHGIFVKSANLPNRHHIHMNKQPNKKKCENVRMCKHLFQILQHSYFFFFCIIIQSMVWCLYILCEITVLPLAQMRALLNFLLLTYEQNLICIILFHSISFNFDYTGRHTPRSYSSCCVLFTKHCEYHQQMFSRAILANRR